MNAPPLIPDHTLLQPIGRGAYGEVWLARNVMGTLRAVKVVQRAQFESDRPYEREFAGIQRYEPVSRSSGGLVHLLHVGRNNSEGYFYYVMELADDVFENPKPGIRNPNPDGTGGAMELRRSSFGLPSDFGVRNSDSYLPRTLHSDLKRLRRLPTADCLRLALDVVSGLARLHFDHLVHRDVKPSNIIFVSGRAKLADIGLVTTHGEGRTFVGTEGYIPPEGPGSPAADLYALGIVLYEASTGWAPDRFPDVPAEWFADRAGDDALEFHEVILKACEAQRERRYQSAAEMQADLALLHSGQSVRRVRALERRYARLRIAGVVATALLVCAIGAALFANYRARVAAQSRAKETALREEAENSLARAEAAERASQQQLYTALLEQARATVHKGELGQRVRTLDAIQRAVAILKSVELRQTAFAALALPDLRLDREITFAQDEGGRVCDPTFERYAVCVDRGAVEVRAIGDRRLLASLPAATNALGYVKCWSGDGRYLAVKRDMDGGRRGDLEVWNLLSTRRVLHAHDHLTHAALSFHPMLPQIAAGRLGGGVTIWDVESGREIRQFQLPATPYWLSFAPDGERIAVSYDHSGSNLVAIIDAATGTPQTTISCPNTVLCVAWQPQGRWVAIPDLSSQVRLIDLKTGEARILGQHKAQAVYAAFSPNGDFLITGGWERELICWDMRTQRRAFTIGINSERAQFSADGRKCAIHVADRLQIYDFQVPSACRELPGDLGQSVFFGEFSADSQWFSAGGDRFIGVWDLQSRGPPATLPSDKVRFPFFSQTASEIYAHGSGLLDRWRMAPAENEGPPQLTRLPLWVPPDFLQASVLSNELVLMSSDGLRLMPLGNTERQNVRHLKMGGSEGRASPDGRWLGVMTRWSPVMSVYRLPELEKVAGLTNRADVCRFVFSPRSDELAVVTHLGLEFYDTIRWQRQRELRIGSAGFANLHFTPDGESFWLTSDRRTAALRNTRSLEVLLPLPPGTLPLAVSPDGRHLAVSVDLRRVQVWDLADVRLRLRELGLDWAQHQ